MEDKNCKYMRSKYNWTPNDYELTFPHNDIPVNIPLENVPNLSARIKTVTPLSKNIHLTLNEGEEKFNSTISIVSELFLSVDGNTVKVNII